MDERRFAYRVSPEADEVIRATVSGDDCQSAGEVTDLSLKGVTVCISLEENPSFYLGEKVTLTLNSRRLQSVRVLAAVQSRAEGNGFRRFGLAFPDPSILRARLSVGLLRMFNERHACRVEPRAQERLDVKIYCEGFLATGYIRDLSADGIAAVIDLEAERRLSNIVHVNVEFQLPGQPSPSTLHADVRNRYQLAGEETACIGLRFDPDVTPACASHRRSVADYVEVRQRELRESLVAT